jgi:MFS superfamily sulfate permease-like transporter
MWLCQVSLMVAVLYLLLAVLRLGFLCSLLSRPIISAFLTSGALIISSSQVRIRATSVIYPVMPSWTTLKNHRIDEH